MNYIQRQSLRNLRALTSDLSSGIQHLKQDSICEGQAGFQAVKSIAFGTAVKDKRLASSVSKIVSLHRLSVSRGIKHRFSLTVLTGHMCPEKY